MIPIRFGAPTRPLTGFLHAPAAASNCAESVLLCNPFGQEAIRSHRLIRLLADRLAKIGFSVLRFDYFATGDSAGADDEADLDGWLEDVLYADETLVQRTGNAAVSWAGIRLGGSIAAMGAERRAQRLKKLVLWDPVVSGEHYLSELAVAHMAAMHVSYGIRYVNEAKRRALAATEAETEALGFPLPLKFKEQISAIKPLSFAAANAEQVKVFCNPAALPQSLPLNDLVSALQMSGVRSEVISVTANVNWTANDMMNSSVVPADILAAVTRTLSAEQ